MKDRRIAIGIAIGLVAALVLFTRGSSRSSPGRFLSDAEGPVDAFVIQYVAAAAPLTARAYRDFLTALPANRTVHVACPALEDFEDLRRRVGEVACRLEPAPTGHEMTCWSRDRWLALRAGNGETTLLLPNAEEGHEIWPARAGDHRVGGGLAIKIDRVKALAAALGFDGGDFVADRETVFVTPRVAVRNHAATPDERTQLEEKLTRLLGVRAVLLEEAPPYHAGMFMMLAGDRTVLVGEPVPGPVDGADAADRAPYDAVADRCREEGYRVVRMPVVPGADGRTWLTGLNAILDEEDGERIVYMPAYTNAPELTDAAEAVWAGLGFAVRRVDCTETYRHFGSLRCLVSVLRRGE